MSQRLKYKVPIDIDAIGYIKGKNSRNIKKIMDENINISIKLVKINPLKPYFEIKGNCTYHIIRVVIAIINILITFRHKKKKEFECPRKRYIPSHQNYLIYVNQPNIVNNGHKIPDYNLESPEYRPYTPDYSPPIFY